MTSTDSEVANQQEKKKTLWNDDLFRLSLIIVISGIVIQSVGMQLSYLVPPESIPTSLLLYNLGFLIFIFGVIFLIAALGRYISKKLSDQDFWWIIKTGPFTKPT